MPCSRQDASCSTQMRHELMARRSRVRPWGKQWERGPPSAAVDVGEEALEVRHLVGPECRGVRAPDVTVVVVAQKHDHAAGVYVLCGSDGV